MNRIEIADIKAVVDCLRVLEHFGRKSVRGRYKCAAPDHNDCDPSMNLCHSNAGVKCHACGYGADCVKLFGDLAGLAGAECVSAMGESFQIQPRSGQARPSTRPNGSKVRQPPARQNPPPSKPKGEPMGEMTRTASYFYHSDDEPSEVLRVDRMEQGLKMPDGSLSKSKEFPQFTKDATGNWRPGYGAAKRQPVVMPYAWQRLITAPSDGSGVIFFVEGEKDADNLNAAGFYATCVPGSQKSDWDGCGTGCLTSKQIHSLALLGCRVVVIPDADAVGWRKAADNVRALCEVRDRWNLVLSIGFLDLGFGLIAEKGKDASDFLETRGPAALARLLSVELVDFDAPDWKPELLSLDKIVDGFKRRGGVHANQ